jgi:hypothetical protein
MDAEADIDEQEPETGDAAGVYPELGGLPPGTLVTEDGLAHLLGRACRETIKRAVDRGELPRPVRLMGRNTWTAGAIVRHMDARLDAESRRYFGPGGKPVLR